MPIVDAPPGLEHVRSDTPNEVLDMAGAPPLVSLAEPLLRHVPGAGWVLAGVALLLFVGIVVPAVWSSKADRRDAAWRVLDRLLPWSQ
ncbi:hypothetical protein HNR25_002545 [Streptomonospora salina]|uniref:Uncharacterized protein n=1 Tax=Streptomonospora salina TaxID=104205 RepID=A0A841E8I6_9ACTN|nr:hypothetical protein [Streptomonospora salina]